MAAHASGSIFAVSCFAAVVLAYSRGLSLSTLAVSAGAPIEAAASLKSNKVDTEGYWELGPSRRVARRTFLEATWNFAECCSAGQVRTPAPA